MKTMLVRIGAALALAALAGEAVAQAQARAYCVSLRFQRGTEPWGLYSLDLSGIRDGINGELFPIPGTYSHASYLSLNDQLLFDDPVAGTMWLNVPSGGDANQNGWPDFFEVAQAVGATSAGVYEFPGFSSGTVQATWSRAAGSRTGTCVLTFRINPFQTLGVFTHAFELIEYAGPLTYTPGTNTVTGRLSLTQTGNPANRLGGPVAFAKSPTNPYNELQRQAGAWTNANGQTLTFLAGKVWRDLQHPTNYYGAMEFEDGDLNTADPDYYDWILSIDDPNDADGDGIPNFSDDPPRPRLTLQRGVTNLALILSGEVGRVHRILESTNLSAGPWLTNHSLTLTNNPQTITLPLPPSAPRFWRALAE